MRYRQSKLGSPDAWTENKSCRQWLGMLSGVWLLRAEERCGGVPRVGICRRSWRLLPAKSHCGRLSEVTCPYPTRDKHTLRLFSRMTQYRVRDNLLNPFLKEAEQAENPHQRSLTTSSSHQKPKHYSQHPQRKNAQKAKNVWKFVKNCEKALHASRNRRNWSLLQWKMRQQAHKPVSYPQGRWYTPEIQTGTGNRNTDRL